MHWKNNILLLIVLFFLVCSCKKETGRQLQISEDIPGSFLSFYEKFHRDSFYQMEHIIFPLEGLPQDSDSTFQTNNYYWSKEDWIIHGPFDDKGGTFQRSFLNIDNIILEKIFNNNRNFEMERRFAELQGEWHLIYYAAMQKI